MSRNIIKTSKTSNSQSKNDFLRARLSQQCSSLGLEEDDLIVKHIENPIMKIKDSLLHGNINLKQTNSDIKIIVEKLRQSHENSEFKKRLKELRISDKLMPQSESHLNISSIHESFYQMDINSSHSFLESGDANKTKGFYKEFNHVIKNNHKANN